MARTPSRPDRGFTLIEVLIVVVVVAVLAMVVLPRLLGAGRTAKEAALQADLHVLRQAVESYRADTGGHPLLLGELLRQEAPKFTLVPPDGRPIRVLRDSFRGPYLVTGDGGLPRDPMTGSRWWGYDWRTGRVWSRADGTALDGTAYADW